VLDLHRVSFSYPGQPPVLRDVDLTVRQGELVVVVGPSGGGKSTLLRLLCGLEAPGAGRILLRGQPVETIPPPLLRRSLAYVGQQPVAVPGSVRDNLLLGFSFAANADLAPPGDDGLLAGLAGLELEGVALDAPAGDLSVGERQRLALLRTLLLGPEVLLLDEPTSALDPASKGVVERHLERLNREEGLAMLLVTHRDFSPGQIEPRRVELAGGTLREEPT